MKNAFRVYGRSAGRPARWKHRR